MAFDTQLETVHQLELHILRACMSSLSKDRLIQLYVLLDLFTGKFS